MLSIGVYRPYGLAIILTRYKSSRVCAGHASPQKYPGKTAPNSSMIKLLVQWLSDTGSVADRKRSGRAFIMKTKVADVETS
ncbi:hypothetical protein TNCV_1099921 [Trichonephila clavipes]|nr:hypothetical protein TNCV_1099921 [Trichonephila clavipes]